MRAPPCQPGRVADFVYENGLNQAHQAHQRVEVRSPPALLLIKQYRFNCLFGITQSSFFLLFHHGQVGG